MKKNLLLTLFFAISIISLNAQCNVVLLLNDSANKDLTQVSFKGSYGGWTEVPGYDDGTNGDLVAGDHIWSLKVSAAAAGSYEWGATSNGVWLLVGPNPSFQTDAACGITGTTEYVIPAKKATVKVTLQVVDPNLNIPAISFKGAYAGWVDVAGYDDGTHGDAVAGDHKWTLQVDAEVDGTYEWGADRTDCASPAWIIQGPNPSFHVDAAGVITGQTVYSVPLTGTTYNVTFRVDMSNEIPNANGIFVSGNFEACAWSKNVLQLALDPNHPGIYKVTVPVAAGDYQYKYFNGNTGDDVAEANSLSPDPLVFIHDSCGVANGLGQSNRSLKLTALSHDTVLNAYVFGTCSASLVSTKNLNVLTKLNISPNPFDQSTVITFDNNSNDVFNVTVSSVTGAAVFTAKGIEGNSYTLNRANLNNGFYLITLSNQKGEFITKKLIIE